MLKKLTKLKLIIMTISFALISSAAFSKNIDTSDRSMNPEDVRNHKGKLSYYSKDYPTVSACGFIAGSKVGTRTISQVKTKDCAPNENGVYQNISVGCSLMDYINSCEKQYFNDSIGFAKPQTDFNDCDALKQIRWGDGNQCVAPIASSKWDSKPLKVFNTAKKDYIFGSASFKCVNGNYELIEGICDNRPSIGKNTINQNSESEYIKTIESKIKTLAPIPKGGIGDCDNGTVYQHTRANGCPIMKDKKIVAFGDRIYMYSCVNNKWNLFGGTGECAKDPDYDCPTNYNGSDGVVDNNPNDYRDEQSAAIVNNKLIINDMSWRTKSSCRNPINNLLCPLVVTNGSYNGSTSFAKPIFVKACEGIFLQQKVQCSSKQLNPFIGNCLLNDNAPRL